MNPSRRGAWLIKPRPPFLIALRVGLSVLSVIHDDKAGRRKLSVLYSGSSDVPLGEDFESVYRISDSGYSLFVANSG